jgi:hypothetical protein
MIIVLAPFFILITIVPVAVVVFFFYFMRSMIPLVDSRVLLIINSNMPKIHTINFNPIPWLPELLFIMYLWTVFLKEYRKYHNAAVVSTYRDGVPASRSTLLR